MSTLITGATVVNNGEIKNLDVFIQDGKIAKIDDNLSSLADKADNIIDAKGLHLLPGMIDDQVHFRDPGLTHKADIGTESRAAVLGGVTSYMEMPNTKPVTDCASEIKKKLERASQKSLANFAFYLGATNDNLENIKNIDPNLVCGVKVFMGSSTGNLLVNDPDTLAGIFENSPVLIVTHCEDTPMILEKEKEYKEKYGDDIPMDMHADIRSREACYKSSSLAISLAKKYGSNLHVLHLTTKEELEQFQAGDIDNKKITAEVCVHHLSFDRRDYDKLGSYIKCNPSIKEIEDRAALIKAVNTNIIDIIATDHAPHTKEEKQGKYFDAPAGLPLVQHVLLKLFDFYHEGVFSLEKIVQKISHNVAKRYQIVDRGYIKEGYWADLVLVDLNKEYEVTEKNIAYKCGWSPFLGRKFRSSIKATFVNGEMVCKDGEIVSDKKGVAIEFDRV
jgi:dihydroorotase